MPIGKNYMSLMVVFLRRRSISDRRILQITQNQLTTLLKWTVKMLLILPIEISVIIFGYLDPATLLSVTRTNKFLKEVCCGDPILRSIVQKATKQDKKTAMDFILNPRGITKVTRNCNVLLFSTNTLNHKTVVIATIQVHSYYSSASIKQQ